MAEPAEGSFPACEKIERPRLERAVADREIVIAAGDVERLPRAAAWRRACAGRRRPCRARRPPPARAGRSGRLRAGVRFRREPRMQAASAARSLFVRSAKARNRRCAGSARLSSDGASSASAIASGNPASRVSRSPIPPRIERAHALRLGEREEARDPRPHRIAHHVGALDPQMLKQIGRVLGHQFGAIVGGRVELLALPMAAVSKATTRRPARAASRPSPARPS